MSWARSSSSSSRSPSPSALTYVARRLRVADPILLLLGGIVLSQLPDLPDIVLAPDLVFLLFLPPILFGAAYFTPIRDFQGQPAPDPVAGDRARAVHDGRRGRRGPAADRHAGRGRVRARCHRRAAGRRGRHGDLPAPRACPRRIVTILEGREPPQRRLGPDRVPHGGGRGGRTGAVAFSLGNAPSISAAPPSTSSSSRPAGSPSGRSWARSSPGRCIGPRTRSSRSSSRCWPRPRVPRAEQIGVSGVLATVVAGLITGQRARAGPLARRAAHGRRRVADRHLAHQRVRVHAHRAAAAGHPPGGPRGPRSRGAARAWAWR